MRVLLQRVSGASVAVDGSTISEIGSGLLVLFCATRGDTEEQAIQLAEKTLKLRIFADAAKPMNVSVVDIDGQALVVSQFTLAADTRKGNRPSFHLSEEPARAEALYDVFVARLSQAISVQTGVFGAEMQVKLINDGPVTLLLESPQVPS